MHRQSNLLLIALCVACVDDPSPVENETEPHASSSESANESQGHGPEILCTPGELRCADELTLEVCAATGLEWEASSCGAHQQCDSCFDDGTTECTAACAGPCERLDDSPTSAGCSFYTTGLQGPFGDEPVNALVVTNPDPDRVATLELRFVPEGTNIDELADGPVSLLPGASHTFLLPPDASHVANALEYSMFRSGSVHHLTSDLPVQAYLHAPLDGKTPSASTMLLPEHMLTGNYVVYGYPPFAGPNYFSVIALENQTTLRWWPRAATAGNEIPLPFVDEGQMGEQLLNRFDNVRIDSSFKLDPPRCGHDLSGTVLVADKPIWVVSAVTTTNVPFCDTQTVDGCQTVVDPKCGDQTSDFVMEQLIPLDDWGTKYVGPHAPLRGGEEHHWRVYAGDDDVTITVDPPQPGTPVHLERRGDWAELAVPSGTSLLFSGDGPFMPVQYVSSNFLADVAVGGAAMVQMVPVGEFDDRYVFTTRADFDLHYVQVIRDSNGSDVLLDGAPIEASAWERSGEWLLATVDIGEGTHSLESADAFGAIQYGYTIDIPTFGAAGYGYPVGF